MKSQHYESYEKNGKVGIYAELTGFRYDDKAKKRQKGGSVYK